MSVRHGADRFVQERIGRPLWDQIYREIWGSRIRILPVRHGRFLDKVLGVDICIRADTSPFPLYGQEKTLGHEYGERFDTLTVEHMQDTGQKGDAFKINVAFYACAYLTEDEKAFSHGAIVDWPKLVRASWTGNVPWQQNRNADGRARATFIYVDLDRVPDSLLLWRRRRRET